METPGRGRENIRRLCDKIAAKKSYAKMKVSFASTFRCVLAHLVDRRKTDVHETIKVIEQLLRRKMIVPSNEHITHQFEGD